MASATGSLKRQEIRSTGGVELARASTDPLGPTIVKSLLHSKPPRLLPFPSVSFGDVFSNLPPVDEVGDVVGRPPLKYKRNFWRPTLLAKDRPDFQQIYVPCPRLVYGTNAIGGERRKDVHGENLNHEMSNNDCYDAALKCFRDAIYPSNGVRQSSMKCLNLKTSDPGKCKRVRWVRSASWFFPRYCLSGQ
jgi:hypothetical protein